MNRVAGLPPLPRFRVSRHRRLLWAVSLAAILLSLIGIGLSLSNPAIRAPLRPGLDFTGGTQIQIQRDCGEGCDQLRSNQIRTALTQLDLPGEPNTPKPSLEGAGVQLLDGGSSVLLRLPALSAEQGQAVVEGLGPVIGPITPGGVAIDTIGPLLGTRLLRSSLLSLAVSLVGIALYISLRYDRVYAFLALLCLGHDVLITCGVFAWLGLLAGVEVNSLFAVALLTIAGYSVNDTVVIFDRIREKRRLLEGMDLSDQADEAVMATFTRSVYTSLTTLLPLVALIFFGGSTLFWLAVALTIGIAIGAWSSIGVASTLLPVLSRR
jgi:preprotein translocase subunit SecF